MDRTYDIFISFKNTDGLGNRTKDAGMARRLYDFLKGRGFSVFFSEAELEHLGSSQYRRAIDDALESSRFLVAVGCSREHLEAGQVYAEWSSFLNAIDSGYKRDGQVFTLYADMTPADLPWALKARQAFSDADPEAFTKLANFITNAQGWGTGGVAQGPTVADDNSVDHVETPAGLDDVDTLDDQTLRERYRSCQDDAKKAVLQKALAARGDIFAINGFGVRLRRGEGVPQDYREAMTYFLRAIQLEDEQQVNLLTGWAEAHVALLYGWGYGVPRDYAEAAKWYERAAAKGNVTAHWFLAEWYRQGTGMAVDDVGAFRHYVKLATLAPTGTNASEDSYIPKAQYWLGVFYRDGRGTAPDQAKAMEWFQKAADLGNPDAKAELEILRATGA